MECTVGRGAHRVRVRQSKKEIMKIATFLIAACAMLAGTGAQAIKDFPRSAYKAEMLVKFPESTVACISKEALGEFTVRSLRGEKTKANAIAKEYCTMLSPIRKFKVLSVEFSEDGLMGMLEVVGEKSKEARGAWVFSIGAEPTK